jgi:hypothetical protein
MCSRSGSPEGGERSIAPKKWLSIFCPGGVDEMSRVEGGSIKLRILDDYSHELG